MNRFDNIEHMPLRVFNRTMYLQNLFTDGGKDAAAEYIKLFDDTERKQIYIVQQYMLAKGYKATKEAVTKGMEFTDEEEQVVVN